MGETVVVAVGGNAIIKSGQKGTLQEQNENVEKVCGPIVELVKKGYQVVVTHGNGPQVGNELLKNEMGRMLVPAYSLDVCGAETAGSIGYLLQQGLRNGLQKSGLDTDVVTVITECVVDVEDPGFLNPTKPVGPFYTREDKDWLEREKQYVMAEDSGRGWRRVVPSPRPVEIVESRTIRSLADQGSLVICCGGGGIPVIREHGQYRGVEAVIDKDYSSALLAGELEADYLFLLTGVEKVALNFGKPDQRDLDRLTTPEIETYLAEGQFPPGSMGPKVDAARKFTEGTSHTAIITRLDKMAEALAGQTGTRVIDACQGPVEMECRGPYASGHCVFVQSERCTEGVPWETRRLSERL